VDAIRERLERGRLHRIHRGVYAVGRPELTRHGEIMAAVLACGPRGVVSHATAGELWGIVARKGGPIHLTVPGTRTVPGVKTHRRDLAPGEITQRHDIPVTTLLLTLIDVASHLTQPQLEAAINEADKLGLRADALPALLTDCPRRPGLAALKATAGPGFRRTDSDLERLFLRLVRAAGLPVPLTQQAVSGYRVDFHWPDLNLVVEVDGLTYHRTAAQQARDRARDQAHTAAGLTQLRFSNRQVRTEPDHVIATLGAVIRRLELAA
jgi:very-short-patch-repair endonuclease